MARPLRINASHTYYHVVSRGNERKPVFHGPIDFKLFLNILADTCRRYRACVHSYCLMPNHVHLLLYTEEANLSLIMKRILGVYTMRFNRKEGRVGHLFQGRYRSFVVDKDAYLLELSRYIHLNPVRAGIVPEPEDYPWSSIRFFTRESFHAPPFLKTGEILGRFNDLSQYRVFVREGIGRKEIPASKPIAGVFMGDKTFVKKFQRQIQSSSQQRGPFTGGIGVEKKNIETFVRFLDSEDRNVQVYVLWRWGYWPQREIASFFSLSQSSISVLAKAVEKRMMADSALRRLVESKVDGLAAYNH